MSKASGLARAPRLRSRRFYILVTLAVASLHAIIWLGVWGTIFAREDFYGSSERAPHSRVLDTIELVLGAPLFYLPERWSLALRPILGNDSTILVVQAVVNGLLWGGAVAAALYYYRKSRRSA